MKRTVLFIAGPTGSGKSKLAFALAKKIDGEIISCDAMQVYKGMDIGTAKPDLATQKQIGHHLIDRVSPSSQCSVFKYRKLALRAIDQIYAKQKIPVVVGGSGLYMRAIIDGIAPQPGKQNSIRRKFEKLAQKKGLAALYLRLKKIDPKRARQIHPNDQRRIIRALEIFELSKRTPTRWKAETKGLEAHGMRPVVFALLRERAELYQRIEARVEAMFEEGWVEEVRRLQRRRLSQTARAAIGYHEILEYLKGGYGLEEMKAEIKKRTRHLAKKQMTWFRKDERIHWVPISGEQFVPGALRKVTRQLKKEWF